MAGRVALITSSDYVHLTADDRLLPPELGRLGIQAVPVWNFDKRYLEELERAGVPIVPTIHVARGAGELSHAVAKRPRAGDFRIQAELGGGVQAFVPDPELVVQARACVSGAPSLPTYARVDGVVRAGRFLLMELEVLEPAMYLAHHGAAPARFARAIAARLSG